MRRQDERAKRIEDLRFAMLMLSIPVTLPVFSIITRALLLPAQLVGLSSDSASRYAQGTSVYLSNLSFEALIKIVEGIEWVNASIEERRRFGQIMTRLQQAEQADVDTSILNLSRLELGEEHLSRLQLIADLLKRNTHIKELDLSNNRLGDKSAAIIADLLQTNHTIERLDLALNDIGSLGAIAIAKALEYNRGLQALKLSDNPIEEKGLHAIFYALTSNTTLKKLILRDGSFEERSIPVDCKLYLEELHMGGSRYTASKALFRNNPSMKGPCEDYEYDDSRWQRYVLKRQKDELVRHGLALRGMPLPNDILSYILSFNTSLAEKLVNAFIHFIDQEYYELKARLTEDYGPYPLLIQQRGLFRLAMPIDKAKKVACFEQAIKTGNLSWLERQVQRGYQTRALAKQPSDHWLNLAGQHKQLAVIEFLLNQGFRYETGGESLVHFAARYGHVQALASYWAAADLSAQDDNGNTPLHIALMHHEIASANYLLAQGADVDCANHMEETPIKLATEQHLVLNEAKQLVPMQLKVSNLTLNLAYF